MTSVEPARLTVLSGPSGVGKSTVITAALARHPALWLSVSVTTRPPRPGEVPGSSYTFLADAEFAALAESGQLLEWAEFAGHRYGTPAAPVDRVLAAGRPALLEIDVQGARQVRAALPGAQLVFLTSPSWAELQRRLRGRDTEPAAVIATRLERARVELDARHEFDVVVCNDDATRAAEELVELVRNPRLRPG